MKLLISLLLLFGALLQLSSSQRIFRKSLTTKKAILTLRKHLASFHSYSQSDNDVAQPHLNAQYYSVNQSTYVCPTSYSYLTYADIVANYTKQGREMCDNIASTFGIPWTILRLRGGGSAFGNGNTYDCRVVSDDVATDGQSLCGRTTLGNLSVVAGDNCPAELDIASTAEVTSQLSAFCELLGNDVTARIDFRASITKRNGQCSIKAWNDHSLSQTLCVARTIQDYKIIDGNEHSCGLDLSYVTIDEVMTNLEAYCQLVPAGEAVRISGGASVEKSHGQCQIKSEDRRTLTGALCGPEFRSLAGVDKSVYEGFGSNYPSYQV